MEAGSDLEQRGDAPANLDLSLRGISNFGENFQQRALARAVAADDADNLSFLDAERNIAQRPKGICGSGFLRKGVFQQADQTLAEHRLLARLAQHVLLGKMLHADGIAHALPFPMPAGAEPPAPCSPVRCGRRVIVIPRASSSASKLDDVRKGLFRPAEIKSPNREENQRCAGRNCHQAPVQLPVRKETCPESFHDGSEGIDRQQWPPARREIGYRIQNWADPQSKLNHKGNDVLDISVADADRGKPHSYANRDD